MFQFLKYVFMLIAVPTVAVIGYLFYLFWGRF